MRSEIVDAIKGILSGTNKFGSVIGLGSDRPKYPLARVWLNGTPRDENLNDAPASLLELRAAVQIETWVAKDEDGNTDESGLYDLVDVVFDSLQNVKLPGAGSMPMVVYDHPALGAYSNEGPAVYTMQVSIRVSPQYFTTT